jgi:hypothetical protein
LSAATNPGKADTFLLSCIDPRLTDDTTFHFAALGRTDRYSEMRIAGAALALVDPARPAWRQAVLENLAASIELHGIHQVSLLHHRDCGAMKLWAGAAAVADPAQELRLHTEVLNEAAAIILARHPSLTVEIAFMELDGQVVHPVCTTCLGSGQTGAAATGRASAGFGELVRLRSRGAPLEGAARTRLLAEGVTRYGLDADAAGRAMTAALSESAAAGNRDADVVGFLTSRASKSRQIDRASLTQAARLYRALSPAAMTVDAAKTATSRLAEQAGLQPRPTGIWPFRTTRWFRPSR